MNTSAGSTTSRGDSGLGGRVPAARDCGGPPTSTNGRRPEERITVGVNEYNTGEEIDIPLLRVTGRESASK